MDGSTVDLRTLLLFALNDAPVYSALVPWMLDCNLQAPALCDHVQQRQVLQQFQLQQPRACPHDMRQCVQLMLEQCCSHACSMTNDVCPANSTLADQEAAKHALNGHLEGNTCKLQHSTHGSNSSSSCGLSAAATRLAKLHGHLLAHGLLPNLTQQLQVLVQLLTSGPLLPNAGSGSGGSGSAAKRTPGSNLKREKDSRPSSGSKQKAKEQHIIFQQSCPSVSSTPAAEIAAAGPNIAASCEPQFISSSTPLLGCCACAARYAAKALECSGRLLACLPSELLAKLAASPHAQQYGPGLIALLGKTVTVAHSSNSILSTPATTPHQQQRLCSGHKNGPASAPQSHVLYGSGPPSRSGVGTVTTGPWSAAGTLASRPGSRPSSGVGKLSGLGLLTHTGSASAGGQHGPSPAGSTGRAAANAAVCNREKSRDLFFSLLRRCSSRLEALRQQQAAAAGLDDSQQRAAAITVATTELQELLTELGLAAKQLLLQLAPGNQAYLAELFTACVLQAASSGEPILEPQLALMAQREPSKFQKLQQRLADNTGSSPVPGLLQPAATTAAVLTSAKAAPVRRPAGATSKSTAAQAGGGCEAVLSQDNIACSADRGAVATDGLHTPVLQHAPTPAEAAQQQQQQAGAVCESTQEGSAAVQHHRSISSQRIQRMRPTPASQGLAATGLLYKLPPGCGAAASTGGHTASSSKQTSGILRQIRPAPSGTNNSSTGGSFRLAAASGISTPLPFLASKLDPSPGGASPLVPQQQQQQQVHTPARGTSSAWAGGASRTAAVAAATLHTPASAPAAAHVTAGLSASGARVASAPQRVQLAPAHKGAGTPAAAPMQGQHANSSTDVVLQLLAEVPAGQHVLLLVLHAADSSSFNRSLLQVMLARAERLLSSCPDSLDAVGGLGQQAASLIALASYCSYLAFVAGTVGYAQTGVEARPTVGHASSHSLNQSIVQLGMHSAGGTSGRCSEPGLLQQQPVIDVAALLERVLAARSSSSHGTAEDPSSSSSSSWCLALAIPFACQFLRFAQFNAPAASSATVTSALQQLRALQALPCMAPSNEGFGRLAACLSTCLAGCQLLQQPAAPGQQHAAAGVAGLKQPCAAEGAATVLPIDRLNTVVTEGNSMVDDVYWGVCCPGLQQVAGLLSGSSTTAQKQQQAQPLQRSSSNSGGSVDRAALRAISSAAAAPGPLPADNKQISVKQASELDGNSSSTNLGTAAIAAAGAKALAAVADTAAAAGSSSSPGSVRHTTPLLLAPRVPPTLDSPPACLAAALAGAGDPIKQQLQQAFIAQYSTDDNPVKMRDVLSLVNSILCANSLTLALGEGVPCILQQHLDAMQQEVSQQLAPTAQQSDRLPPPQGQELARAIHAICTQHSMPAILAALESAMQRAAAHANQAAAAACAALLPAEVPPAAAAAAAALVAASCQASCAQRLLQEVPTLVQSQLADHADELVRVVARQWAVHDRMTAAPSSSSAVADSSTASSSPAPSTAQVAARQRLTAEPVGLADSSSPANTGAAKTARRITAEPVGTDDNRRSSSAPAVAATSACVRHITAEAVAQADSSSSSSVCSCGPNTARRIHPAPEADTNAAESAAHPAAGGISSSGGNQGSSSGTDAAAAGVAAVASTSALQTMCEAATAQLVTADTILQPCNQPAVGICLSAQSAQWLTDLQHAVATAVAQQSLQDAVGQYLAATAPLLPNAAGDFELCVDSCADSKHSSSLTDGSDTVQAALRTAEVLIAGVTVGQSSLSELEQLLLVLVNNHTAAAAATPAGSNAAQQTEQPSVTWTYVNVSSAQQTQLCQLLAGAVLYAFLTDSRHKLAVWSVSDQHVTSSIGSSTSLSRFVKLPAVLMKIARADGPLWLLHRLRVWLQAATLGSERVA